ncbi:MAG: hypothetical protein IBX68_04780 [Dehalococcoidia bacterium]|nr:hypothetical protein [Dehalococcoidia bacterium]
MRHSVTNRTGTMNARNTIASCLVIALGVILALHFAMFWMYGSLLIYEDNKTILAVETVMSLAILLFGVERLLSAAGIIRRPSGSTAKSPDRLAGTSYAASATSAGTVSTVLPDPASPTVRASSSHAGISASCSCVGAPADVTPFLAHLRSAGTGTEVQTGPRA